MADSPVFSLFQLKFLTGEKPIITRDEEFLKKHTKVLLRSDDSDRVWKVKLDGNRLSGGWEEFAGDHKFRDGDVLVFRHDGEETFHVSVSSVSISSDLHHASCSYVDTEDGCYIDNDYVESEDEDDDDDEEDEDNEGNISVEKNKKQEEDSSSDNSCFINARVTRYSLHSDRLDLSRNCTRFLGEHNETRPIDLVNEKGRRWTLILAKNISSGVFYMRRGWSDFCYVNELSQGEFCKFKLVENGERPVLSLCPREEEEEECSEVDAVKSKEKRKLDKVSKGKEKKTPRKFLTFKYTPSRNQTGQLSFSTRFARENGVNKPGDIILLDKDGRKWKSYIQITGRGRQGNEWFYLRGGWREMCKANGVNVNDSFEVEMIWEYGNPMLKFCSKIENKGDGNRRTRNKRACETAQQPKTVEKKRARSRLDHDEEKRGGLNRTSTNPRKLQRTQPNSFSVSDQVTNVKRGVLDALNTVRQFRLELETREQSLEASLQEIEALGEMILGISNILNNNMV